jgi:hypothetical protein
MNDEIIHKKPEDLIKEIEKIDQENKEILTRIKKFI